MTFKQLQDFLENKMRMSHIHQAPHSWGFLFVFQKIAVECVSLLYIAPYPRRFQVVG